MGTSGLLLYDYWRSSASYRVRLALAWKGLEFAKVPIDLRADVQASVDYRMRNRQGLVPLLVDGEVALAQSLAIIEYLDEIHPEPPLLPADPIGRARVRGAAQIIACDVHPINNLRVLRYLKDPLGQPQAAIDEWVRHWIAGGLAALEAFAEHHGGDYLYGDVPSLADLCLVPQLYNARRVETALGAYPRLRAIENRLLAKKNLLSAHPVDDISVTTG